MIDCAAAIKSGKCHSAECCGIVPFPKEMFERFQISATNIKRVLEMLDVVFCVTDDYKCAFLDRKSYTCKIYGYRPEICKLYGMSNAIPCPVFKSDGAERTRAERRTIQRQIDARVKQQVQNILKVGK